MINLRLQMHVFAFYMNYTIETINLWRGFWMKFSFQYNYFTIIIRCVFSFLFIGRGLTTSTANNCLQTSVLLQIFCSCVIETTLLCENGRSLPRVGREWFDIFSWSKERWWNDKTVIELGYRKIDFSWFVSDEQIN